MNKTTLQALLCNSPLILFAIFLLINSCGPSKQELERQAIMENQKDYEETSGVTVVLDNCGCNTMTLLYYQADSCMYIGSLGNSSHDFIAHAGQCKYCQKRQAHLIDSLIKKNLREFFALSKDSLK